MFTISKKTFKLASFNLVLLSNPLKLKNPSVILSPNSLFPTEATFPTTKYSHENKKKSIC